MWRPRRGLWMGKTEVRRVEMNGNRMKMLLLSAAELGILLMIAVFIWSIYSSADRTYEILPSEVEQAVFEGKMPQGAERGSALDFRREFGMDPESFDGVIYYKPVSNMDVTEVIIAGTGAPALRTQLEEAINSRISAQKSAFEGYAPLQYGILQEAVVSVKGNYVFYAASEDADRYYEKFAGALKNAE